MEANHEIKNQSFLARLGSNLNTVLGIFEDYSVTILYLIMVGVIFLQIVTRAMGASLPWSEELARYIMAYAVFIGASIAAKEGAHIGIIALVYALPQPYKKIMKVLAMFIAFIFSALLVYLSLIILQFLITLGQVSPAMRIPMWTVYAALPLGATLMSIRFLQQTYKQFKLKEEEGVM